MSEVYDVVTTALLATLLNSTLLTGVLCSLAVGIFLYYIGYRIGGLCAFLVSGAVYFAQVSKEIGMMQVAIMDPLLLGEIVMAGGTIIVCLVVVIWAWVIHPREDVGIKW